MAVILLIAFPHLYGDHAKVLNSIISEITNFDGHLPSIPEGSLLLVLSTFRVMDAAREWVEITQYHWILEYT